MSSVPAWVMQVDRVAKIAVGQAEIIHIVHEPGYIKVPCAPDYCNSVIYWNKKIVPVMNLSEWFNDTAVYYHSNLVAITVYMDKSTGSVNYGGIQLLDPPVIDYVNNDQLSESYSGNSKWKSIAVSCYRNINDENIPIIDLYSVFGKRYSKL